MQSNIHVSYQGIKGAWSELAAKRYFKNLKKTIKTHGYKTFDEMFNALENKSATHACVPVENSVGGSIHINYHLLKNVKCSIIGEIKLRITWSLLALPDTRIVDIKTAISHPEALKQCRDFFKNNKHIKAKTEFDTAGSAKIVCDGNDKTIAAIASKYAGKLYKLKALKKRIETNKENYTRFLIVQKKKEIIKNSNKISLLYAIKHQHGTLVKSIMPFSKRGLSLTKIESIPIQGKPWEYYFFVDYNVKNQRETKKAIDELRKQCIWIKVLGWYKKGKSYDN